MVDLPANCEIFVTQDGTPTLLWKNELGYGEKMHHSAGALGESVYIYHSALARSLELAPHPRVLSLGLGLAYNEFLAVGEFIRRGITGWKLWSFESQAFLRESFRLWLDGQSDPVPALYAQVCGLVSKRLELEAGRLEQELRSGLMDGRLQLRAAFPADAAEIAGCTCVFYDAYSKKMNPELWSEPELTSGLRSICGETCVLATYAATGSLNRALKTLGFQLSPRPGFMGKRESTLAVRERSPK
jgi:hypothetical protein